MVTALEPDARFTASAQSSPSSNTQSHVQDRPDKALAVLLTHISNSHATLVGYLDQHARTSHAPSAAIIQAQSGPDLASAGLSTGIDDLSAWASNAQEASETMADTSTQAPMQLLPYQQELADCIMEEGSSVIFLPSGGHTTRLTVTLSYLHVIIFSAPVKCLQAALCIHVFTVRLVNHTGTGQVIVAASVTQKMLAAQPQKHVIYLTDRVHLLYQQAALFSSQLGHPVGR